MATVRAILLLVALAAWGIAVTEGFCLILVCSLVKGAISKLLPKTPTAVRPILVPVAVPIPGPIITAVYPPYPVTVIYPVIRPTTPTTTTTSLPTYTYRQDFINQACGKVAYSSSGNAAAVVDCDINTCMTTSTQTDPWVEVNMEARYLVNRVRVWTKGNIDGFRIDVDDQLCGSASNVDSLRSGYIDVWCNGLVGQTIRVTLQGTQRVLQVCEIEVDGSEDEDDGSGVVIVPLPGTITLTLVDQTGAPFSFITVNLVGTDGSIVRTGTTNSQGQVTFTAPPGRYIVQPVFPSDRQPSYPNDRFSINLVSGQNPPLTKTFVIPSLNSGTVTVRIIDSNGNPVSGITLEFYDENGVLVRSGTTNSNGSLTVTLPPGNYTIRPVFPIGQTPVGGDDITFSITVTPGGRQTIEFVVPAVVIPTQPVVTTGNISGSIYQDSNSNGLFEAGEGIANIPVYLYRNGVLFRETYTNGNGFYQFTLLAPGTYTVIIGDIPGLNIPEEARTKVVLITAGSNITFDIQVLGYPSFSTPSRTTTTRPTVTQDPLGTIVVRVFLDTDWDEVYEASELLLADIPIALINSLDQVVGTGITSSGGLVTFSNVPMGIYTVLADLSTRDEVDVDSAEGTLSLTRPGERFSVDFAIQPYSEEFADYSFDEIQVS